MKLGSNTIGSTSTNVAQPKTGSAVDAVKKPQEAASSSVVDSLSNTSKQALAKAKGDAPIDMARVDEIRAAIREGRFEINAEAISEKLIESAKELAGRR